MDAFALLDLERGPWVDRNTLKENYVKAAKQAHPDRNSPEESDSDTADQRSATINQALRTLENPVTRLAHFIELETGQDVTQDRNVPDEIVPLFMELGPLLQEADQSIHKLKAESSPILKSRLFLSSSALLAKLSDVQARIQELLAETESALEKSHTQWIALKTPEIGRDQILRTVGKLYPLMSFLQRWRDTITEKSFELTPG